MIPSYFSCMEMSFRLFRSEKILTLANLDIPVMNTKRSTADTSSAFSTPKNCFRISRFSLAMERCVLPFPRCSIRGLSYSSARITTDSSYFSASWVRNVAKQSGSSRPEFLIPCASDNWTIRANRLCSSFSGLVMLIRLKSIFTTGYFFHSRRA